MEQITPEDLLPSDRTCLHSSGSLESETAEERMQASPAHEDLDDFDEILLPLECSIGSALNEPQRSECRLAFEKHPVGFRIAVRDSLARHNCPNRIGLLVAKCRPGKDGKRSDVELADRLTASARGDERFAAYAFRDDTPPERSVRPPERSVIEILTDCMACGELRPCIDDGNRLLCEGCRR